MSRQRPNVQTTGAGRTIADRLPPHSPEAEMGVLGCCLIDPQKRLPECQAAFGSAGGRVFYDQRHGEIYEAMTGLQERMAPVDLTTVYEELKRRGTVERVGGIGFLGGLPDAVSSAWGLPGYVVVVWGAYLRRSMYRALANEMERVMEYSGPAEEVGKLLDGVEGKVLEVQRQAGTGLAEARGMPAIVGEAVQRIEEMRRGVGLILGIRTHFGHLDKWTAGLHRKQLTILAARPSIGKTALAMCLAENVAGKEKVGVGVFSMEMEDIDLILRMLCKEAGVDSHKLRTGFASHADLERIPGTGLRLSRLPIWIDGTPGLGILELRARARRMVSEHGVGVIVVDYIQLMRGSHDWKGNRALELGEISSGLKGLGKELNVAVLCLAQLNRETEKQRYRKPQLADLRDSGAIEQDADTVLMLYLPKCEENEEDEGTGAPPEVLRVNALIAKQRHGPRDWDVEFLFERKYTRFADAYGNRGHELPNQAEQEPQREGKPRMGPDGTGGFHGSESESEPQSELPGGEIPEDL